MPHFLEDHLKSIAGEKSQLFIAWSCAKTDIPQILSQIPFGFPTFSRHDESHSEKIIEIIEQLLGNEGINVLSPTDTFMLLMAAYSHDIGMYLSYSRLIEEFLLPENQTELNKLTKHRDKVVAEAAQLIKYNWTNINEDRNVWIHALEISNAIRILTAQIMRKKHAERSYDYILNDENISKKLHLDEYSMLKKSLAKIAHLHGTDFQNIFMELDQEDNGVMGAFDKWHPRFVACMIRQGDLLDISDNRFNLYTIHQIKELPDISSTHKQKHECIEKLNICKEIITATFNCPNDAVYREVAKWCEMLCEELKEQRLHWNDIVPEELSRISFFPPYTKKGNDGIKILFQRKSDINPALMNLQFNISSQKTFEMLKGGSIYENPGLVFFREIVQNALDATKLQIWNDLDAPLFYNLPHLKQPIKHRKDIHFSDDIPKEIFDNYPINLKVDYDKIKQIVSVTCEDCGSGISEESLIRMTSQVGTSRRADKDYVKTVAEMPYFLQPTATFGLGLQTIFYVADEFTVETRCPGNEEKTRRIVFRTSSNGSYCSIVDEGFEFIRNDKEVRHGTTVKINIDKDHLGTLFELDELQTKEVLDNPETIVYLIPDKIDKYVQETFQRIENIPFLYNSPFNSFETKQSQEQNELLKSDEKYKLLTSEYQLLKEEGDIRLYWKLGCEFFLPERKNISFLLKEKNLGICMEVNFLGHDFEAMEYDMPGVLTPSDIRLQCIPVAPNVNPYDNLFGWWHYFAHINLNLFCRDASNLVSISRNSLLPKGRNWCIKTVESLLPILIRLTHEHALRVYQDTLDKDDKENLLKQYFYLCLLNWQLHQPIKEVKHLPLNQYISDKWLFLNNKMEIVPFGKVFESEKIVIVDSQNSGQDIDDLRELINKSFKKFNTKDVITNNKRLYLNSYICSEVFHISSIVSSKNNDDNNDDDVKCYRLTKRTPDIIKCDDITKINLYKSNNCIHGYDKYKRIVVNNNAPLLGFNTPFHGNCWIYPIKYDIRSYLMSRAESETNLHKPGCMEYLVPDHIVNIIQKYNILGDKNLTKENIYDTYIQLILDNRFGDNKQTP